jgi:thioredoxin 2
MSETLDIVACETCGATNRVRPEKLRDYAPVCGRCGAALQHIVTPIEVTDASFASEVEASSQPVLLDVWAPWCAPCRAIAPMLDNVAREMTGRLRVAKLNVDENPMTAARLGIQGVPTLILYKHGHEIDRIVGAPPREMLLSRLRAVA